MEDWSIGEFAARTGAGIHTLRYYEREGLLAPSRDAAGRRRYSEKDAAWMEFVQRLRATGMPIREMKRYAAHRAGGDGTIRERLAMLLAHREKLLAKIAELKVHEERLEEKIAFYEAAIAESEKGSRKEQ